VTVLGGRVMQALSSLRLSCTLLILLGLLTWLGTLEQAEHGLYEVQRKYFESYILFFDAGPISVPLPGANLVMTLLFFNIVVGGIVRLRKTSNQLGVLIVHVGMLLLFAAGFIKLNYSEEGHVTLYEGDASNTYQSYHKWEVAVSRMLPDRTVKEWLIPGQQFLGAHGDESQVFRSDDLPFDVVLSHVMSNSRPLRKGPMFEVDVPVIDGQFLKEEPRLPDSERNTAGVYVSLQETAGDTQVDAMLWGRDVEPYQVDVDGVRWGVQLRRERYPMPFTIALDDFIKEEHPGTMMPKWFSSDVTVVEEGSPRSLRISMNEPLRNNGLVMYQASWGPANAAPGTPLFSTLAVVRNPSDQYPLYACILIAIGLLLHFMRRLSGYIRAESRS
jgi:hypothetical protein